MTNRVLFSRLLHDNIKNIRSHPFACKIKFEYDLTTYDSFSVISLMTKPIILRVAVPVPIRKLFDYKAINPLLNAKPGYRVKVPFGKMMKIGIIVETCNESAFPLSRLKAIHSYIDAKPLFDDEYLKWMLWISQYYHHPIGETLFTAVPNKLKQDKTPLDAVQNIWIINSENKPDAEISFKRSPKQQALYEWLKQQNTPICDQDLNDNFLHWRPALKGLVKKGLVSQGTQTIKYNSLPKPISQIEVSLNEEQLHAANEIKKSLDLFKTFLLNGVTGSGKTEVYINIIAEVVSQKKQAILLIPEIGLTPQFVSRFNESFSDSIVVMHSRKNDTERLNAWRMIQQGEKSILLGTRSAVFTPCKNLGIIIIDEEHDTSFKQQEGLRYSTRDIASVRAKNENIPLLLGTATPSFESIANVLKGQYTELTLLKRAASTTLPKYSIIDLKNKSLTANLSPELLSEIKTTLEKKEQILLFLNRRGFAPTLICHQCGWIAACDRCDHNMTVHFKKQTVMCHHCGANKKIPLSCPSCQFSELNTLGYGTEQIEQTLSALFPDAKILRIDRDSTSRKNRMQEIFAEIHQQEPMILVGTQMLAKGHDFPNVTLVGILEVDQGLFGSDMRASEHIAQLITQVSGRAGRGKKPGNVFIQTYHPEHQLLTLLINKGYMHFCLKSLEERKAAFLPPYSHATLIRAEANQITKCLNFLTAFKQAIYENQYGNKMEILGPIPSPMQRKAGKHRFQLLLISPTRNLLHSCLNQIMESITSHQSSRTVRWSIDIDPIDMS